MIHAEILPDLTSEPRRREPRLQIDADLPIRPFGATAVSARLINISSSGFMAETRALIEAGTRVWITLPGADRVNALVLWSKSGQLGGEFTHPIDPLSVIQAAGEAAQR